MEQKLNLSLQESLIRGMTAILLPMLLLLFDHKLILYVAPVIAYLYITALTHICPVKHAWRRITKHPDANNNYFWDRD